MKSRVPSAAIVCVVALLGIVTPAFAHRLDEYLQATTITVSAERIELRVRLTAGVTAAPKVLALMDTNGDGVISDAEQRSYAEVFRRDVSLDVNGKSAPLSVTSTSFPTEDAIRQGLGDIILAFVATVPRGTFSRRLTFTNHHQRSSAAYLVNTLVPDDPSIHIVGQDRTRDQSSYQLDFTVGSAPVALRSAAAAAPDVRESLARGDKVALVRTYVWHGVHHILSGFDHLLFLAALVLGAATLWDLLKVVTAFTIAHSVTLTLAALGWVHLPGGVVEPLIAASIVFVAVQNVFWPDTSHGRTRLVVAFAFGLFHGLGFAGGLLEIMHQMPTTMVLLAIFGFSVGVEAGNQIVLLPLFALLKLARRVRAPASAARQRAWPTAQRIGSAVVSLAGLYYLGIALVGA